MPFLSTWPIQDEPGRIPSRATEETRREAATMQTDMFCTSVRWKSALYLFMRRDETTHHEKTDDGDDRDEDLSSRAKGELKK
jgi:hypothetical protein